MKKTFKNRNIVTLYIRDDMKIIWEKFMEVSNKDKEFKQYSWRKHDVTSIALTLLAYNYLWVINDKLCEIPLIVGSCIRARKEKLKAR